MRLYIIGNGFDMSHGLPSSYDCFCGYMRDHHPDDYNRIGRWYDNKPDQLWSDYENMLSELKIEFFVERNVDNLIGLPYYQIENAFDTEFTGLKSYFHEWVIATLSNQKPKRLYAFDTSDLYITFNYTNTLETVYHIGRNRILYIHGDTADNAVRQPIVGHGVSGEEIEERVERCRPAIERMVKDAVSRQQTKANWFEKADEICNELKTFLKGLRKDVEGVMLQESDFFERLGYRRDEIMEVVILGHSLAEVDAPYFHKITTLLNGNTCWKTDYFPHEEEALKQKQERFYEMMGFEIGAYDRI